jgi:hypothetical protein
MSKLSPTQERILTAAAKKPGADIRKHFTDMKSPAIKERVLESMLKNGLVVEADHEGGIAYVISDAGLEAVGAAPRKAKAEKSQPAKQTAKAEKPAKAKAETLVHAEVKPQASKSNKLDLLVTMLSRKQGATVKQLMEATGWVNHSVRGAISGGLRKKMGLNVITIRKPGKDLVYRIEAEEEQAA